ncbi:MAG: TonB family protein [Nitrospiraceae bacterium]
MSLFSNHQDIPCIALRPPRWFVLLGGFAAFLFMTASAIALSSTVSPQDLRIEIPENLTHGSLPTNRGLRVSVYLPERAFRTGDSLVAVIESPAFAQQMSPLLLDSDTKELSTTVDLGPISVSLGDPPKAAAIHVAVARQQGLHLEELARRTVIVTVAVPGYTERSSPRPLNPAGMSLEAADIHHSGTVGADPTLLDDGVEEFDLLGNSATNRAQGYWKVLNTLIRQQLHSRRSPSVRRMPVVHFRLYMNGEAQLIEIERSSGDTDLDQAAILAVVNAHPFPPFPAGTGDSYVDVHVGMPAISW